jgi:ribonuclease BN (tRNA processing enzyme)
VSATGDFRVTLLGTGTPIPRPDRFGPSTLVEAGDQKLLIDAGRGVTIRLFQLGVPMGCIDALLLTHYHSDHTVGIPDFWLTGWLYSHFARRTTPLRVIGPLGAKVLMSNLERAYGLDLPLKKLPTPEVPFKGPLGATSSMCRSSCRAHSQQPPPPPFVGVSLRKEQYRLQPSLRPRLLPWLLASRSKS